MKYLVLICVLFIGSSQVFATRFVDPVRAFLTKDKDKDGNLSFEEFRQYRDVPKENLEWVTMQEQIRFYQWDRDADEFISRFEWELQYAEIQRQTERSLALMSLPEKMQDTIRKQEEEKLQESVAESMAMVEKLMKRFDTDGDGNLNEEERKAYTAHQLELFREKVEEARTERDKRAKLLKHSQSAQMR